MEKKERITTFRTTINEYNFLITLKKEKNLRSISDTISCLISSYLKSQEEKSLNQKITEISKDNNAIKSVVRNLEKYGYLSAEILNHIALNNAANFKNLLLSNEMKSIIYEQAEKAYNDKVKTDVIKAKNARRKKEK